MVHTGSVWRRARMGVLVPIATVACAATLAACGSSDSDTASTPASGGTSTGAAQADGSQASMEKAQAGIEPFLEPSPIPVDEPLTKKPPAGSKVVFISCKSPECQQFIPGLKAAAAAAGVELETILAGTSAQDVNSAFQSAAQMKPLAIIDPALDPSLWRQASKQLQAQGTPVIGHAVIEPEGEKNFAGIVMSEEALEQWGRIQADFVYTKTGDDTKAVALNTPEFKIFKPMADAFTAELESLCPSCEPEVLDIPAAELGTKAPSRIVSYLQAHPDVNWVVTSAPSQVFGLPPALKAAGLKVNIMSDGGLPQNYEYIKSGDQVADLSLDYNQETWLMMDQALRAGTGQEISPEEFGATASQQIITKEDVTFDPAQGWTAFPDYQETFKKLWNAAG
jgi:ribose transport system substrate-binding protein